MTTTRRTALAPFLLDLLDFMEEKIREAMADETSQVGAISEAAGVFHCCVTVCAKTTPRKPSSSWSSTIIFTNRMSRSGGRYSPGWIAHLKSRLPP